MNDFLNSYWTDLSQFFSNSQQRLFWGYLLCAFCIALLWSLKHHRSNLSTNITQAFGLKHILSRSCLADLQLIIINKAIFLVLLPILITKLVIATSIFELLHYRFSPPGQLEHTIPTWLLISIFTLFVFLLDDFARFYLHKKMHQIPWLWEFHKYPSQRNFPNSFNRIENPPCGSAYICDQKRDCTRCEYRCFYLFLCRSG